MSPFLARVTVQALLPFACAWAKWQERRIRREGVPLPHMLLADARRLGVRRPERVRMLAVKLVPGGMPSWLRTIARPVRLLSPLTSGMSLRYGIFVRSDCWGDRRLLCHELVHTAQYERLGGFWPFLKLYLFECLGEPGYPLGPLEQEAQERGQIASE
jgi:hypothetical protein